MKSGPGAMSGVVVGIVKEVDARLARIKVDFPWMQPPQRSDWAPIATLMSGGKRGMYFMPELEDEVLLAFLHGEFDHPYVVGFLWNGIDAPPENDARLCVIVTPGKHTLRFDDTVNAKKIVVESSSGHTVILDDSPGGRCVTVKTASGGQSIVLDDKTESIELRGGGRTIALVGNMVKIS
jgi:uncharacterized protein involved in type VI secretion and phage assembly